MDVQLVNGGHGEFTVLVDGREVIKKQGEHNPPIEKVLAAVRDATKTKEKAPR